MTFLASPRIAAVVAAASLLLPACYSSVVVKPTELPKLGQPPGSIDVQSSGTMLGPDHDFSTGAASSAIRFLERPDGRVAEIRGDSTVMLATPRGTYTFEYPVLADVEGPNLRLRGSNRGSTTVPLADITTATVKSYDRATTSVAVSAIVTLALGAIALGFTIAADQNRY
jgi:hypothetical protein